MSIAIAILANKNLHRVAQVATYLSKQGVNVCVHIDAKESDKVFSKFCNEVPRTIRTIKRQVCEWGEFSLVDAELRMCREIFEQWPDTSHVQLISGDTLPIKPLTDLNEFLTDQPDTDFIESFAVDDNNWVTGGLGVERFTLRFPFSWKTQRRRFDIWVDIQRRLGIRRSLPDGLTPYIGSQWWCLTRETILAILDDPKRDIYDAYFRKCWIPDESYFQTLVRKHARKIISKSLVYSKFDHQGKPVTFYNDHLQGLEELEDFFVRKIWDGADLLYKNFLSNDKFFGTKEASTGSIGQKIEIATNRRKIGRIGLRMQGREPNKWHEPDIVTSHAYDVFVGYEHVISGFSDWIKKYSHRPTLGYVFDAEPIGFPERDLVGLGGISSHPKIRDVSPRCFLTNLVWQYRLDGLNFSLSVECDEEYQKILACDRNAHIHHIRYSWLFKLFNQNIENEQLLRRRASEMMSAENEFLVIAQSTKAKCQISTKNLSDCYSDTHAVFSKLAEQLSGKKKNGPLLVPKLQNMSDIGKFARRLKDIGVDLDMDKVLGLPQARPNSQVEINR